MNPYRKEVTVYFLTVLIGYIFIPFSLLCQSNEVLSIEYGKVGYTYDFFKEPLSDWHGLQGELKWSNNKWSLLPSINIAQRFDQWGLSIEGNTYRNVSNGDYFNLSASYSPSSIFVRHTVGGEYFKPMKKWEISGGARWMNFDQIGNLAVFTTSVSKYYGKFLSSLRFNAAYSFLEDGFNDYAAIFSTRYYTSDKAFWSLVASYGFSPALFILGDEEQFLSGQPTQYGLRLIYQTDIKKRNQWSFFYAWSKFDFNAFERLQHSIGISFIRHRKQG